MTHNMELDWLKKWNLYSPTHTAIVDGETGRAYTYAELYRASLQTAFYLKSKYKIASGDRVAVLSANELEYIFLFFALQRLGAILVPVNFRLTARELTHIFNDSSPALLLHQAEFSEIAAKFSFPSEIFVGLDSFSSGASAHGADLSVAQLELSAGFVGEPDSAVMILYTSGTTGAPKGAVLTQSGIFWNSINTSISINLTQSDSAVIFLPFFHTGGWNVLTTPVLHRGGKLIFLKKFDADLILSISESEKCTLLFGVPTTMDMMARHQRFAAFDLTSLRYAIVGGEPMPLELINRWHNKGVPVRQGYGLTEFGPNVFSLRQEDSLRKIGSIGFPNFYCEARIISENGEVLGANEIGELVLKGPMCMREYWQNTSGTKETIRDGWLYTGDLVRKDNDGFFYVVGRKKDMYISGAENVYPPEVEQIMLKLEGLREVAVIGIPDDKWGEVGKAFIVRDDQSLTEESILKFCSANLAKYKIPKKIVFLESLPKGDSGKILKKNLSRD